MIRKKIWARLAVAVLLAAASFGGVQAAAPSEKDDFYHAVNAQTLAVKEIEPTEPSWSWFSEQSQANKKALTEEVRRIAADGKTYERGSAEQKIADVYRCAVDMKQRDETARKHIGAVIAPIKAARSAAELTKALQDVRKQYGVSVFADYTVSRLPDKLKYGARVVPTETILTKYELEKEQQPGAWQAYKKYIADVLVQFGAAAGEADEQAEAILAMERQWAPHMLTSEERNDVAVMNRLYPRRRVEEAMPNMDGKALVSSWGLTGEKEVFLADLDYLKCIDASYTDDNLPTLKSYAVFRIADGYAPYADRTLRDLQRQYVMERFGIKKSRSDEETAGRMVQNLLSYEVGQIYLKKHCTPETVARVKTMIDQVRAVYKKRLAENDWLSAGTKKEALKKLDSLRVFVGGPAEDDKPVIENMPDVIPQAEGGDLLGNMIHNAVLTQEEVRKLVGKKCDPDKWYAFQPQDVNAAYIPENNSITIPAGILTPPFYSPDASKGENLGGIGVVIGHEISHAFDPNGSQYDQNGKMKNWWTDKDYKAFQKKADAFAPYYDAYEVGEGLHEKGKLVANEAIADCGGLSVVTEIAGGDEGVLRDAYRNFARIFAQKMTPQLLAQIVQTDPHPIGPARVNGALSATDGFYDAYDVTSGDGMYVAPDQRVKLW